jgi:Flp pilus assembly protein TadD
MSYSAQGMHDRAITTVEKARELAGGRPDIVAFHGYILARAGRRDEALKTLRDLRRLSQPREPAPFLMALVYVGLDDMDRAFESLDQAVDARNWETPMIKANPIFERIRSDPRFPALLRRIGLPD